MRVKRLITSQVFKANKHGKVRAFLILECGHKVSKYARSVYSQPFKFVYCKECL